MRIGARLGSVAGGQCARRRGILGTEEGDRRVAAGTQKRSFSVVQPPSSVAAARATSIRRVGMALEASSKGDPDDRRGIVIVFRNIVAVRIRHGQLTTDHHAGKEIQTDVARTA